MATDADTTTITDAAGRTLTPRFDKVREGVERLIAAYPGSANLDDCAKGMGKDDRALVCDAIFRMLLVGMIQVSSEPVPHFKMNDEPKAAPLALVDAADGAEFTANYRHETVSLDPAARTLLATMNGKGSKAKLMDILVKEGVEGRLTFSSKGEAVTDKKGMRAVAEELLPQLLNGIENAGLLIS